MEPGQERVVSFVWHGRKTFQRCQEHSIGRIYLDRWQHLHHRTKWCGITPQKHQTQCKVDLQLSGFHCHCISGIYHRSIQQYTRQLQCKGHHGWHETIQGNKPRQRKKLVSCLRPLFLSSTHIPPIHHRQCCGNLHINAVKQLLWWRKPLPIWRERQDRLQTYMDGYYKLCLKPNMAHYERTDENHFLYTQINQKEIDVLAVTAYAGYWLLPEKLQLSANGGLNRCFNYGFD